MTYKRYKASCLICQETITTQYLVAHFAKHDAPHVSKTSKSPNCIFCGELFVNTTSHSPYCQFNPSRIKGRNASSKAKSLGLEWIVLEETRSRLSLSNTGRKHTEETKAKISMSMSKAVLENPESYMGRYNRGTVKEIICTNGMKVLGGWEQTFVEYCLSNKIQIETVINPFDYVFEEVTRKYFPDFYLPEFDTFVEVKGWKQPKDIAKWDFLVNGHNKKLLIISKTEISELRNNTFLIKMVLQERIELSTKALLAT